MASLLILYAALGLSSLPLCAVGVLDCLDHRQGQCFDVVSMIQTSTMKRQSHSQDRQGSRKDISESSQILAADLDSAKASSVLPASWMTITPYKAIAANVSEVTPLPQNLSIGQLLAYEPSNPANNDLFVFLPGSWVACSNYSQLLETMAPSMRTLCLPYDNVKGMGQICGEDSKCWYEKRIAAHNGSFEGVAGNNIIARLTSALEFLQKNHGPGWASYWNSSAGLKFDSMRFAGHSQGAGAAAFVGYVQKVARVVQFSGPCDASDWPQAHHPVTPTNRFFAMASSYDHFCDYEVKQMPAWWGEGILTETAEPVYVAQESLDAFDPQYSQSVISLIESPVCNFEYCLRDHHDSTALNKWAPPSRAPYAMGLWQRLAGI